MLVTTNMGGSGGQRIVGGAGDSRRGWVMLATTDMGGGGVSGPTQVGWWSTDGWQHDRGAGHGLIVTMVPGTSTLRL